MAFLNPGQPVARVHAAILQLAESLPLPKIERILTSTEAAVEEAQDALERADLSRIYSIAVANQRTYEVPGAGALLLAVLPGATDQPAAAATNALAQQSTAIDVQRNANFIRLRNARPRQTPNSKRRSSH